MPVSEWRETSYETYAFDNKKFVFLKLLQTHAETEKNKQGIHRLLRTAIFKFIAAPFQTTVCSPEYSVMRKEKTTHFYSDYPGDMKHVAHGKIAAGGIIKQRSVHLCILGGRGVLGEEHTPHCSVSHPPRGRRRKKI